jgi:hypothetical protein
VLLRHIPDQPPLDKEVTVHELAHQWAGHNLTRPWLWEGMAEYATRVLAPELGVKVRDWGWQNLPYKDPIATWYEGSPVHDSYYWYGKSGAFFLELEKAIGGREPMKALLAAMDDDPEQLPLDGRWLMDTAERVSKVNLDELFLTWVFQRTTAESLIRERRAAYTLLAEVEARIRPWGFEGWPTDVAASLRNWQFKPVAGQAELMNVIADEYTAVVDAIRQDELTVPAETILAAWNQKDTAGIRARLRDIRQTLDAIRSATTSLANQAPDETASRQLAEARAKFSQGDMPAAKALAAGSQTVRLNKEASRRTIALAKETQANYDPSFFGKVGLLWMDPESDLAKADAAYEAGEYTEALKLSRSAYDAWGDATNRGLMRLAILCAVMCGVSIGGWWLIKRLEPDRSRQRVNRRLPAQETKPKSTWRNLQGPER